jgi:hypothetical protein
MVAELSQLILKEGGFSAADTRYLDYCFGYHPVESKGRVDADVGWCIELVGDVERGIPSFDSGNAYISCLSCISLPSLTHREMVFLPT